MAEMQEARPNGAHEQSRPLAHVFNLIGAVTSLALVIGVGVWGYKLVVRDVSGVPVVRAAEGPMRVTPDKPGGQQAAHQGLSVNSVAAEGTAADPADRLILAPEPLDLTLEDTPAMSSDNRRAEAPEAEGQEPDAMRFASVENLAEQLAAGATPLQDLPDTATPENTTEIAAATAPQAPPKVQGGLGRSLRPRLRPATLSTSPEAVALASIAEATLREIDPATIPVGTRLAQLGAFGSREVAEQEWVKLSDRFAEYLEGKDRVIEKATSGGRTFYRLRAMGFADLSDARRFCSALVSERAECIPVVTR